MTSMPPRWQFGLAAAGCVLCSVFAAGARLMFTPTDPSALAEASAPVVGWQKEGETTGYDLLLELEGQPKKFRVSSMFRAFGDGFETIETEAPAGTPMTVLYDRASMEGDHPAAFVYALKSPGKAFLTLEQSLAAERDNVAIAVQLSLAFGAGAAVMLLGFRYYDALCRLAQGEKAAPAAGKDEDGAAAVAAAVARLSDGKGGRDAEDLETLRAGWLLVPSLEPVTEGRPFPMPSTTNGAGEKVAYLFSHRAAFDAWGNAPHFVELQGRDAFRLVLAGGFFGAAIDVSGPRMLGLTRGVLEDLAEDDS